jgi:hypothetical protein
MTVSIDGNYVFFLNDGLYSMAIVAASLPTTKMVDQFFYGVDVDPQTGNIVCLDAINSNAVVYNTSGVEQSSFETEAFPNSVVFSY